MDVRSEVWHLAPWRRDAAWPKSFDAGLQTAFASRDPAGDAAYRYAFRYLLTSFCDRRLPGGAAVRQPGARSSHGFRVDALEGFSRLAPLLAAWVAGGREPVVEDLRGRRLDVVELLIEGLVTGARPGSVRYWGDIEDRDQRIIEATDIARVLWIGRDFLCGRLSGPELEQLTSWLLQVNDRDLPRNNWLLCPVVVNEVLHALGQQSRIEQAHSHFEEFMRLYRGGGWFSDGEGDRFDWYNAWAIHYDLFWLREMSAGYRTPQLDEIMRRFAETMPYLISPNGIPIMGRSVCYRLAAPAPLVAAAVASTPAGAASTPGLSRRALDAVWSYFAGHSAFERGRITQGYFGTDLRILDNYSGPSSPLWGTRPLTLAFLAPPEAPFWTAPLQPLPVEVESFSRPIPAIGWELAGDVATGEIRILRGGATLNTPVVTGGLNSYGLSCQIRALSGRSPRRPD
ncbi:MAG TPA: DUF2264 domain-containing protein, partial [Dehalococcoidia bacterium]